MNTQRTKNPLYQELYLKLRRMIEDGVYPVGSKLPSEKELADERGVSRITSKHALDRLASEGFIRRYPGKGSYVQSASADEGVAHYGENPVSSRLIGVVMDGLQADFGAGLLFGLEKQCEKAGYSAVIKFTDGDEARECARIDELMDIGVDGMLLMCVHGEVYNSTIMKLALEGFPLVFMDRSLFGLPVPYVGTNHYDAAFRATAELYARGHRNIALAMAEDSCAATSAEARVHGYVQCCIENELLCANRRMLLVRDAPMDEGSARDENIRRVREFMDAYPETSAVLALSTDVATHLIDALNAIGKSCAIASFDGPRSVFKPDCEFMYVQQDQLSIGMTACARLIDKINGMDVPMTTNIPYRIVSVK